MAEDVPGYLRDTEYKIERGIDEVSGAIKHPIKTAIDAYKSYTSKPTGYEPGEKPGDRERKLGFRNEPAKTLRKRSTGKR